MRKITTYSALFFIFFGFAGIGGAVDLAESVTEPLILLAIGLILILVQNIYSLFTKENNPTADQST